MVGLRSPVSEIWAPARELKRVDLPLPLAPAMATTVCREESLCLAAASSSTRPASARAVRSSRALERPTSSRSASRRGLSGLPEGTYASTWGRTSPSGSVTVTGAASGTALPVAVADLRAMSPSSQPPGGRSRS